MREPRPSSPARLRVKSISTCFPEDGDSVELTVKLTYYTWCCSNGAHELSDAAKAVERLFSKYEDMFYDLSTDPLEIEIQKEIDGRNA